MTDADKQLDNDQDTVQSELTPTEPMPVEVEAEEIPDNPEAVDVMDAAAMEENLVVEAETTPTAEVLPAEESQDAAPEDAAPETEAAPASADLNDTAIAEMTQTIESLKAQLDDRNSQYMRIAADFDNFRRRTLKEKEELEQKVKCSTISELLPVVDNFERARVQLKPQNDSDMNIHKSYQSVYKQLVDCLKRIGVAPMHAKGKPFDPSFHEAVVREPTHEHEDGTVLDELVRGYMLGERVLRHALVKVAVPAEDTDPPASEASES